MAALCTPPWLFVLTEPCRDCLPTLPDLSENKKRGERSRCGVITEASHLNQFQALCKYYKYAPFHEIIAGQSRERSECLLLTLPPKTKSTFMLRALTATRTEELRSHLEGFISDNWMRGSNSYLKRARLAAPSEKGHNYHYPKSAQFTRCYCQCEMCRVSMAPFVWSPASSETFPEPRLTKACFFLLCKGSLLAAHSQYPLIKPVTPPLTVTLKKHTKVTLCFENMDAHRLCLSVSFELSPSLQRAAPLSSRFSASCGSRYPLMSRRCLVLPTCVVRKVGEAFKNFDLLPKKGIHTINK